LLLGTNFMRSYRNNVIEEICFQFTWGTIDLLHTRYVDAIWVRNKIYFEFVLIKIEK